MLTRSHSDLPEDVERTMAATIDAAIAVHRELGPGFLERIYQDAMCLELTARSIPFERERAITVRYRDTDIRGQRIDLIIDSRVIVELKAVLNVEPIHRAKVISYLKTTGMRAGLLINFHERLLKHGMTRIVL